MDLTLCNKTAFNGWVHNAVEIDLIISDGRCGLLGDSVFAKNNRYSTC